MLSELAMGDIADLEEAGTRLTPSEIVLLNALGLRVEQSTTSADIMAAPRIAWAGPVPIYQPTEQVEQWMAAYGSRFTTDEDSYFSLMLFASAHGIRPGFFLNPELHTPEGIQAAILKWRSSLPVTNAQLQHAFKAAYFGTDPGADAYPEPAKKETDDPSDSPGASLADHAIAAGLGLSLSDLGTMPSCRILAILRHYYANQGCAPSGTSMRAHADYIRTRSAIRRAHGLDAQIQQEPTKS